MRLTKLLIFITFSATTSIVQRDSDAPLCDSIPSSRRVFIGQLLEERPACERCRSATLLYRVVETVLSEVNLPDRIELQFSERPPETSDHLVAVAQDGRHAEWIKLALDNQSLIERLRNLNPDSPANVRVNVTDGREPLEGAFVQLSDAVMNRSFSSTKMAREPRISK